ncbi:MAG TPA: hypothetical protein DHV31_02780 [Clostridiales bacterium]|nr:hypothetical protein [Clostridiales bacterium]
MPSDYVTLNALAAELNDTLSGGKIRRICQPEKDEITISVYNGRTNLLLVISANPNSPRIHLTTVKKENPYAAPPLLMILRKYVGAAVIKSVSAIANDRIIEIALRARNEMFDDENFYLVCELMGRYSNIILLNQERRILDSLYKLIPDEKQKRQIMIGAKYLPPEQNKVFIGNAPALEDALRPFPIEQYKDFLVKQAAGVSQPTAKSILQQAENENDLTPTGVARVAKAYADIYRSPYFSPSIKTDTPHDFYPYSYPFANIEKRESLNACADEVFSLADKESRLKAASKSLEHALRAAVKKTENAIGVISQKVLDGEKSEEIRVTAELITTNLYKIKPGDKTVTLFDYYTNQERTLPLDPILRPNEYAQKLFKKYQKLKRGKEINEKLLKQNEDNLLYYHALETELKLAETPQDLALTEESMREAGLIKAQRKGKKKEPQILFLTYEKDGHKIYCGKGGLQNEYVTFKVGRENDIWLHAAKSHGAHVILSTEGKEPPEALLLFAAEIAAYYSERREDLSVEVDYTKRKNVRRHPAKKVGLVYYTDYKTIAARPNAHEEAKR